MFMRCWTFALGICILYVPAFSNAAEWPQFRGPGSTGVSTGTQLPDEWSKDKNVVWKAAVPGFGWSSPVVWGDKVIVTSASSQKQSKPRPGGGFGGGPPGGFRPGGPGADEQPPPGGPGAGRQPPRGGPPGGFGRGGFGPGGGRPPDEVYRWEVYCLDRATGKILWKQLAAEQKPTISKQSSNSYATETPVTDGERVYAYFGMTGLYCYDLSGKLVWNKDLGSYPMAMGHGTGSSPTLDGDRIFVQCDNEKQSFLVALDKRTGKELWRVNRSERTSWSTPLVWKNKQRTEVVCLGNGRVRSYDPATGKQLWELGGVNGQPQASPVAGDELLYVGTGGGPGGFGGGPGFDGGGGGGRGRSGGGGGKPLFAVKAGASGDITLKDRATSNDGVAWYLPQAGPATASPLLYEGNLYVLEPRGGLLSCYDAKTGKQVYKERLTGARGFTASPCAHEGKLFCLDEDGQTFIIQAGPTFKLIGKNKLEEMFWSSPAIAEGALFLRGVDNLYCIKAK
jgi:outer membrane protein assembly factor BamB